MNMVETTTFLIPTAIVGYDIIHTIVTDTVEPAVTAQETRSLFLQLISRDTCLDFKISPDYLKDVTFL